MGSRGMEESCLNCPGIPDGSYSTPMPWGQILASWKVGWVWTPQASPAVMELSQNAEVQQMVLTDFLPWLRNLLLFQGTAQRG